MDGESVSRQEGLLYRFRQEGLLYHSAWVSGFRGIELTWPDHAKHELAEDPPITDASLTEYKTFVGWRKADTRDGLVPPARLCKPPAPAEAVDKSPGPSWASTTSPPVRSTECCPWCVRRSSSGLERDISGGWLLPLLEVDPEQTSGSSDVPGGATRNCCKPALYVNRPPKTHGSCLIGEDSHNTWQRLAPLPNRGISGPANAAVFGKVRASTPFSTDNSSRIPRSSLSILGHGTILHRRYRCSLPAAKRQRTHTAHRTAPTLPRIAPWRTAWRKGRRVTPSTVLSTNDAAALPGPPCMT
jgi:hypothetical protein